MNIIDLLKANAELEPEAVQKARGSLVSAEFRKKYSQDDVEAIVNNYILDPTNEEYKTEMDKMQAYRAECKAKYSYK